MKFARQWSIRVAGLFVATGLSTLAVTGAVPIDSQYYNPDSINPTIGQPQPQPQPQPQRSQPSGSRLHRISAACGDEANSLVYRCMAPVKRYAEVLGNSTRAAMRNSLGGGVPPFGSFSNLGQEVFKELCGLIYRFDKCVAPVRRHCDAHLTLKLMDASYGFLCTEGFQTFYDNADCLMELDQRPEAKQCHDQTMSVIDQLNAMTLTFEKKMEKMCRALNYFAGCVKGPVSTQCGARSWHVIFRVLRDTTQTVMPDCPFDTSVVRPVAADGGGAQRQPGAEKWTQGYANDGVDADRQPVRQQPQQRVYDGERYAPAPQQPDVHAGAVELTAAASGGQRQCAAPGALTAAAASAMLGMWHLLAR